MRNCQYGCNRSYNSLNIALQSVGFNNQLLRMIPALTFGECEFFLFTTFRSRLLFKWKMGFDTKVPSHVSRVFGKW